jgi:hypothetical protein
VVLRSYQLSGVARKLLKLGAASLTVFKDAPIVAWRQVTTAALVLEALSESVEELVSEAYDRDDLAIAIKTTLAEGATRLPPKLTTSVTLADCTLEEDSGHIKIKGQIYVPDTDDLRLAVMTENHNTPVAGHSGRENTYQLIARTWYWPGMANDVKRYVANCHTCKRSKSFHDAY